MSYCRHYRIFRIDLHEVTVPGGSKLFENTQLKRECLQGPVWGNDGIIDPTRRCRSFIV